MPAKFDRCVKKVKAKDKTGKYNPYAVCRASLGDEITVILHGKKVKKKIIRNKTLSGLGNGDWIKVGGLYIPLKQIEKTNYNVDKYFEKEKQKKVDSGKWKVESEKPKEVESEKPKEVESEKQKKVDSGKLKVEKVHKVEKKEIEKEVEKPKTQYPKPSTQKIIYGTETKVHTASESIPAKYGLIELRDLEPSHIWSTFTENPNYPKHCQEREYHLDKAEQNKVENIASQLDARLYLTDDPTAENGPPIITKDGIVLGGNARAMALKRVFAYHPDRMNHYEGTLLQKLRFFGLTQDDWQKLNTPILVRVVNVDMQRCSHYSWILNTSLRQEASIEQRAIAYAKDIRGDAIEELGTVLEETEVESLAEILNTPETSRKLVKILRTYGIINERNTSKWLIPNSYEFTPEGKLYIETILISSILQDKQTIEAAKIYTNKIIKAIPYLVRIKKLKEDWNIIPEIEKACWLESQRKTSRMTKNLFLNQGDMFPKEISEKTLIVWDILDLPVKKFREVIKHFVETVESQSRGGAMFELERTNPLEVLKTFASRAETLRDDSSIFSKIGNTLKNDPLVKFIKRYVS